MIPLLVVGIFAAVKASGALETLAKERAVGSASNLANLVQEVLLVELKVATEISITNVARNAANHTNIDAMNQRLIEVMQKIGKSCGHRLCANYTRWKICWFGRDCSQN